MHRIVTLGDGTGMDMEVEGTERARSSVGSVPQRCALALLYVVVSRDR
jgi:hypothetical protein